MVIGEISSVYKKPVFTEIAPLHAFYLAEERHQDYCLKDPEKSYCIKYISPKLRALGEEMKT